VFASSFFLGPHFHILTLNLTSCKFYLISSLLTLVISSLLTLINSSLLTLVREGSPPSTLTLDRSPSSPPVVGLGEVYRLYGHPAGPPAISPPPPVGLQVNRLHRLAAS
jgi:hypothetical protein